MSVDPVASTVIHNDRDSSLNIEAAEKIRTARPGLEVLTAILEGSPKKAIVKEAKRWGAELILVGSHGYGAVESFVLG